MSAKVTVKAGKNGPVFLPVKLDGRATIGDEPVEVESTRFIRGRIAAGDLVEVQPSIVPPMPGTGVIVALATTKQEEE
jgi:hypothetical protein